jgi:HK97 family phage major capsid protein
MPDFHEQRQEQLKAAKSIIDAAKADNRPLTDDERTQVREHMKSSEDLLVKAKDADTDAELRTNLSAALKEDDTAKGGGGGTGRKYLSIGDAFVKSDAYLDAMSAVKSGSRYTTRAVDTGLDLKALTTTTAGLNVGGVMDGPFQTLALNRPVIADLLTQGTMSGSVLSYLRETAATNGAAAVAESGLKPASDLALERVQHGISKIATTLDVPDEFLEDMDAARSYIDGRLTLFIQMEEEDQLLNGSGVAPNLQGILNTSGIQTTASAAEADNFAAFYRAITAVRQVAMLEPDGVVINPTDYQNLRLSTDANGQFYGGGPFTGSGAYGQSGAINDPGIWGLRTVVSPAVAAGTAVVAAWRAGAQVFRKGGITVDATNSDEGKFKTNITTIRAEERVGLAVYRPAAFNVVTLSNL